MPVHPHAIIKVALCSRRTGLRSPNLLKTVGKFKQQLLTSYHKVIPHKTTCLAAIIFVAYSYLGICPIHNITVVGLF